jgi:hypothetical protein
MSQEKKTDKIYLLPTIVDEGGKIIVSLPKEFFSGRLVDYEGKVVIRRNVDVEIKECPTITDTSSKEEKLQALVCQYLKILKEGEAKHD